MSYCRWSSDDWQCDVYVYEHVGGWWQTHVAGRKRRLRDGVAFPPEVHYTGDNLDAWYARDRAVLEMIGDANEGVLWDWEDLPELPDDGNFRDATPGECADRLEWLRGLGYRVPQYAIDELREEAAPPSAGSSPEPTHPVPEP